MLREIEREFGAERVTGRVETRRVGAERQDQQPGRGAAARAPRDPGDQRQRRAAAPRLPARRSSRRSPTPRSAASARSTARAARGPWYERIEQLTAERGVPAELRVRRRDRGRALLPRRVDRASAQDAGGDRRDRGARRLPRRRLRDGRAHPRARATRCGVALPGRHLGRPRLRLALVEAPPCTGSRTTGAANPVGATAFALVRAVPFALLFAALREFDRTGLAVLAAVVGVRLAAAALFMATVSSDRDGLRALALLPLRDLAGLASWAVALFARRDDLARRRVRPGARAESWCAGRGPRARSSSPATTSASRRAERGDRDRPPRGRARPREPDGRRRLPRPTRSRARAAIRGCAWGSTSSVVAASRRESPASASLRRSSSRPRRGADSRPRSARSSKRSARTGLALDHADGHQHMHLHPTVSRSLLAVGREFGLPRGARAVRAVAQLGARARVTARCGACSAALPCPGSRCCAARLRARGDARERLRLRAARHGRG